VNSLGTDFRIWNDVDLALGDGFSLLSYDMRGHGLTDLGEEPLTMAHHAGDLAALLDALGIGPVIVCGISLGGMTAMKLAAQRPDLVRAMVLCDTNAKIGTAETWNARIKTVREGGIAAIADGVLAGWFTASYRDAHPGALAGWRNMLTRQPLNGYIANCAAIRDTDLILGLASIAVPTLCVAGVEDPTTTPAMMADLARAIPIARLETIPDAAHIPAIEQPQALADLIGDFVT
jgi:3-oxoadipate enol-lactonase